MRRLVYDALPLFTEIDRRLRGGERVVSFPCDLPPGCAPTRGKIYFFRQGNGVVVGICDCENRKTVRYDGDNRDLKYLVTHQAIFYDNIYQIFNLFYRMDAVYSTTGNFLTYYIDGHGYYTDGKYRFELAKVGGSWRAYILQMPSLNDRPSSSSATHRLTGEDGRKYVCVQGNVPTKERMAQIAKKWANCLQHYIKTGEHF